MINKIFIWDREIIDITYGVIHALPKHILGQEEKKEEEARETLNSHT